LKARTLFCVALLLAGGLAEAAPSSSADRSLTVTRCKGACPLIDGRLDEPAWASATPVRTFVQRTPDEGAAPREASELRVLYAADAIYVGLRLSDREPEKIRRGLGRRDAPPDSDRITIFLDPVLSGDRGYWFQVNASGVLADGVIYREIIMDGSWDGVWQAETSVDEGGWTAEVRIPLSGITYQDLDVQRWGVYVQRYVQRTKEKSGWPAMPRSSVTFVSRFGKLEGLQKLARGSVIRVLPFVAAEFSLQRPEDSTRPDGIFRPNAGLDLRLSFSGGAALSAAINPDFGQVEVDPAVVNLSPNEVVFGEKRPFFVEGATLFTTPIKLLHTRRIGAKPAAPSARSTGTITEVDPEARIIGAAKLLGHHRRVSYGLLDAVVLPSAAVERAADGSKEDRVAMRGGNFAAARVVGRPASWAKVGVLATALNRFGAGDWATDDTDAYSGGLDWDLRSDSGWQTRGQISAAGTDDGEGYGLWVTAGQRGAPRWRYWIDAESFSEDFEINHVGHQWRNNMARMNAYLQHRLPNPWGALRELYVTLWGRYGLRHEDPTVAFDRRVELSSWIQFQNHWEMWAGAGYRFATLDDRETRGGAFYSRPPEAYGWLGGKTDTSRRIFAESTVLLWMEADTPSMWADLLLTSVLFDRLSLNLFLRYQWRRDRPRWVKEWDSPAGSRQIFGDLDSDEVEFKLSGVLGVTRALTFQVFGQLLYSVGTYNRYRQLLPLDDGATLLGPTSYDPDANFSRLSLLLNAILRWDLGGGAAAYLVYKLSASLKRDGASQVAFDPGQDLGALFDEDQGHLLLTKLSYGWDL